MDAPLTLIIANKNYSSWSMRPWVLLRGRGIAFGERMLKFESTEWRDHIARLSPSGLVPVLWEGEPGGGFATWDTLAIAEYLNETLPDAGLLPTPPAARARCRSISGEMHSGFSNLRSALPMNLKAHHPGFKVWGGARADIDRIVTIWRECLAEGKGPFLFGASPCMADAMFAPVAFRFRTYGVADPYAESLVEQPAMQEWAAASVREPETIAAGEVGT